MASVQSVINAPAEADTAAECSAVAGSPFLGQHHPHMRHQTRHPHLDPNAVNSTYSLSARYADARPHSAQTSDTALQMRRPRTAHADISLRKQQHRSSQNQHLSASGLSNGLVQDSLQTMQHRQTPHDAAQRPSTAQARPSSLRQQPAAQQHSLHASTSANSSTTTATDEAHASAMQRSNTEAMNETHDRAVQAAHRAEVQMPKEASLQDWSARRSSATATHQPEAAAESPEMAIAQRGDQTSQDRWPDDTNDNPDQQDQLFRGTSAVQTNVTVAQSEYRMQSRAAYVSRPKVPMQALQRSVGRAFSSAGGAGPLFSAKVG